MLYLLPDNGYLELQVSPCSFICDSGMWDALP